MHRPLERLVLSRDAFRVTNTDVPRPHDAGPPGPPAGRAALVPPGLHAAAGPVPVQAPAELANAMCGMANAVIYRAVHNYKKA